MEEGIEKIVGLLDSFDWAIEEGDRTEIKKKGQLIIDEVKSLMGD